ncbi:MAG TPA: hypothetical protein VHT91_30960 [Kofleriaceae bacterium]|jgi:hypothetical protein|nr:hypothetical protein [Kofleriaceae bacterium]
MTRPRDPDAVDHAPGRPGPWRPATRRAFVAALGAAAAALAIRGGARRWIGPDDPADEDDRPPSRWTGTTRWIGHC